MIMTTSAITEKVNLWYEALRENDKKLLIQVSSTKTISKI